MRKPGRIAIAVITAAVVLIGWQVLRTCERQSEQQKLAAWINQYSASREWVEREEQLGMPSSDPEARPPNQQAESAIRQFGSAPMFLALIKTRESPVRLRFAGLVDRFQFLGFLYPNTSAYRGQLENRRRLGAYGLAALGSEARPAVPALIELLKDKDERVRWHAIFALRCLGPEAWEAVPALTECLKDPAVRTWTVIALGVIHQQPERVVPLLMPFIEKHRGDRASSLVAIAALSRFGSEAKAAVPLLVDYLGDDDRSTRIFATNALKAIDPEGTARGWNK